MKNQTIRDRYAALVMLSGRTLPSPSAVNKVTALIARFKAAFMATEEARNKLIAEMPVPEGWDKDTLPQSIAEARQKEMDAYMKESQPIPAIPDRMRLTEADLPRVLKREGGEDNVAGIANIISMLGSLYVPSAEAKSLNVKTEGLEPDELPVAYLEEEIGSGIAPAE